MKTEGALIAVVGATLVVAGARRRSGARVIPIERREAVPEI